MNDKTPIFDNGFQIHKFDNPNFPIYIVKSSMRVIDYEYKLHWHNDWEIVLVTNGKLKFYVDNEIVTISQNEAIFINSGRLHYGFTDYQENSEYICLVVSPDMFASNKYIKEKYVDIVANDEHRSYLLIKAKSQINTIYSMYETAQKQDAELQFQVLLYSLLADLYRIYLNSPKRQLLKVNNNYMQLMLSFIAAH